MEQLIPEAFRLLKRTEMDNLPKSAGKGPLVSGYSN
jgi:hypothetical protein